MRRSELKRVVLDNPTAEPREVVGPWPFLYSAPAKGGLVLNLEPERAPPAPALPPAPPAYTTRVVAAKKRAPKEQGADEKPKRLPKAKKAAIERVSALSLPDVWKRP